MNLLSIKSLVAVVVLASIAVSQVFAKESYTMKNLGGPAPGYGKKQIEGRHYGTLYLPKDLSKPVPAVIFFMIELPQILNCVGGSL